MKPKVLFVTNFIRSFNRGFYEAMAARWDVRFLFFSDGGEWYYRDVVEPLGDLPGRYLPGRWFLGARWSWGLIRELWTTDADVILKCLGGRFALPATFIVARLRRIPFVFWFSIFELPRHGLHRFSRPLVAAIARRSAAVVTNGPHQSALVRELGVDPERISEALLSPPQGPFLAPASQPSVTRESGRPRPALVVGYVGRLEHWKGADLVVRAVARLVERGIDAMLVVAGGGSEREPLEGLAAELAIGDRVRFMGRLPYEALPTAYRAMDVVVIPSRAGRWGSEDWSMVANEAMLSGVPVVASSAVGAVRGGLIEDGVTGRVFPEEDAEALARIISELAGDEDQRGALKRAASARVSGYTYEAAVTAFEAGILRALGSRLEGAPPSA